MSSRRPDLGAVLALAWLSFALLFTMVFGSMLGLRGWVWLGVHLLCVVGCGHELLRDPAPRAPHGRGDRPAPAAADHLGPPSRAFERGKVGG